MTKIFILITLFLVVLSMYIKNKKMKQIKNIFIILSIISIFNLFSYKNIINFKPIYLYGAADFEKYASYAQETMRKNGVYASLTLAQAAVEQGLRVPSTNNLFGIKADASWKGKKAYLKTKECNSNGCYYTYAWFRVYDTVEGSFTDHGDWLLNKFANRGEFRSATTLKDQIISLKSNPRAQYATDPDYLCKLSSVISKYDLTKYDVGISFSGRGINITGEHIENFKIDNCSTPTPSPTPTPEPPGDTIDYNPGTSYTGDIRDGYIFYRLNDDTVDDDLLASKLENGEADKIISEIYRRVVDGLKYNNGRSPGGGPGGGSGGGDDGDAGEIEPGEYSTWKQYDSRWGSIHLGNSKYTIKSAGCAATSVAIQIARSGVPLANDFQGYFNPGSFVQYMNRIGGFTESGAINWEKASIVAPRFVYIKKDYVNGNNVVSTVQNYLNSGNYYLIAHLKGSIRGNTSNHWVAITGVNGNDLTMLDPGGTRTSVADAYGISNIDRLSVYRVY